MWSHVHARALRTPYVLADPPEIVGPKKNVYLVLVSDRPCQFMCDPNYFMSFEKKIFGKKKLHKKHIQQTTCWEYPSPTYHSLPLEKENNKIK